jgi:ankyrin repeat protein
MTAVAFDQVDVVALLLDAGADPSLDDWRDGNVFTFAVSRGVMTMLLSRVFPEPAVREKESLNYLTRRSGGTPLLADALRGDHRMMIIPLPAPPLPGVTAQPPAPYPPLNRLHLLLGLGVDPNERDGRDTDWTPLGHALSRRQLPHAEVLLQYGADPNRGWCTHPRTRRREPDCASDTGPTPLMWARRMGLDDFTSLLLKYGGDPAARDHSGRTAADYDVEPEPPRPSRR